MGSHSRVPTWLQPFVNQGIVRSLLPSNKVTKNMVSTVRATNLRERAISTASLTVTWLTAEFLVQVLEATQKRGSLQFADLERPERIPLVKHFSHFSLKFGCHLLLYHTTRP